MDLIYIPSQNCCDNCEASNIDGVRFQSMLYSHTEIEICANCIAEAAEQLKNLREHLTQEEKEQHDPKS